MSLLKVGRLLKHFGGLAALNDVSFDVEDHTRVAIIGPNGAGKSTLFNIISGELPPTSGAISFKGADVTHLPVYARSNLGIGHTFQRNNLFFGLTSRQNIRLALQHRHGIAGR